MSWYMIDSCSVVLGVICAVLSPILFASYVDDIGKLCDPKHECFDMLTICLGFIVAKFAICL